MDCKFHYKLSAKGGGGGKGIAHSVQGLVVGEGKRKRERERGRARERWASFEARVSRASPRISHWGL